MLKKDQIIIHIGLHKTGTTSIQQFLAQNRGQLGDLDYVCFTQDGRFREDGNSYFLVKQENWYASQRFCQVDIPLLTANIKNSKKKRVMVSSEAFSWCTDKGHIQELKDELLKLSNNVLILAYVREPVSFAISIYTEGLKYPNSLSVLADYNYPCLSNVNLSNQFLIDHYTFGNLLPWKDVFFENLQIRSIDKGRLLENNLLIDVLHVVGLSGCEKLHEKALIYRRENESFNMLQVYYLISLHRFFNKFNDSHRLKSLSYELIKHKIHWLKSDKKFNVKIDVAKAYIDKIRDELYLSQKSLGESVDPEFSYRNTCVVKLSFLDYFKFLFVFFMHIFLFGIYLFKRLFKID